MKLMFSQATIAPLIVALLCFGCTTPYRNISSLDGKRRTINKLERLTPLGNRLSEVVTILRQQLPADTDLKPYTYTTGPQKGMKDITIGLYRHLTLGSPFVEAVRQVRYEFDKNERLSEIKYESWLDSV